MITPDFAASFADAWVADWNSHDLDRILDHYTDDFVIETPMAALLQPESGGIVRGKAQVRAYWTIGLQRIPDLEFVLLDVLTGTDGISIYYRNTATGRRSVEVMFLNDEQKVWKAVVHYAG